jgi:1-acyl-sn-glycerol-3-phosphate acyltransferase
VLLARVLVTVGRPLGLILFRPCVRGREHVGEHRGVVVAPIHLSGFDALAVAYALWPRVPRMMAKNQLFHRPRLGPFIRSLGAFPARDEEDIPGGVAAGAWLAAAGEPVVIFPEGARRRGRQHRLRTGAARTALTADVPLVPAALRGTDGWRRLHRWEIVFGPAIAVDDLPAAALRDSAREATRRLATAISTLEGALDGPDQAGSSTAP